MSPTWLPWRGHSQQGIQIQAGRPLFIYLCIEIASEITSYITVIIYIMSTTSL